MFTTRPDFKIIFMFLPIGYVYMLLVNFMLHGKIVMTTNYNWILMLVSCFFIGLVEEVSYRFWGMNAFIATTNGKRSSRMFLIFFIFMVIIYSIALFIFSKNFLYALHSVTWIFLCGIFIKVKKNQHANFLQATFFAILHYSGFLVRICMKEVSLLKALPEMLPSICFPLFFGLIVGWLFYKTKSAQTFIIIHTFWNLLYYTFVMS
jgi:membrane protease YdiL (CAAX protease family)